MNVLAKHRGLRLRRTLLVVLGTVVLLASVAAHAAAASDSFTWLADKSWVTADAGCSRFTEFGTNSTTRWALNARGDYAGEFPAPHYVAFAIYDWQKRNFVEADTTWRLLPDGPLGLSYPSLQWPHGPGTFTIAAAYTHLGQSSGGWRAIGSMTWRSVNGQLTCWNG
jgi:hypothetical protein